MKMIASRVTNVGPAESSSDVDIDWRKYRPVLMLLYEALYQVALRTKVLDGPVFSLYNYMFTPNQLLFLTQCLAETRAVPGCCI